MFTQFLGKISGVFNLAFQGISKVLGFVVDTVATVVDTVVETVSSLTQPVNDQLSELPIVGDAVDSILNLESNLVNNLTGGLHAVADDLLDGNLIGGVETALNGVTATVGETLTDVSTVLGDVVELATPVTDLIATVPSLAPILESVGDTTSNIIGFVAETGEYVSDIQPLELITDLLDQPTATIGATLQDVSGTLDNLLNDLAPITASAAQLPVVGELVATAGVVSSALTQGLYDAGQLIASIDLLDPLNTLNPI